MNALRLLTPESVALLNRAVMKVLAFPTAVSLYEYAALWQIVLFLPTNLA
jgi:hypothetical protein